MVNELPVQPLTTRTNGGPRRSRVVRRTTKARIAQEHFLSLDAVVLQDDIQELATWANEGLAAPRFLDAWCLSDEGELGALGSHRRDKLACSSRQWTLLALRQRVLASLSHRLPRHPSRAPRRSSCCGSMPPRTLASGRVPSGSSAPVAGAAAHRRSTGTRCRSCRASTCPYP
jgi:hypothetical protein